MSAYSPGAILDMPIYLDISSQVGEEDPVEMMMAKIKEMEIQALQRETEKEEERRRWLVIAKEIGKLEKLEKEMNQNLRQLEKDLQERQGQLEDTMEENKILRELNMELDMKVKMYEEHLRDVQKQNEKKYCEKILQMEKDFERQLEMAKSQKTGELKQTVVPEKTGEYVRQEENEKRKTKMEKEWVHDEKIEMSGINKGEMENKHDQNKKDEGQAAHQLQQEMSQDVEMWCHMMERQERKSQQELERELEMQRAKKELIKRKIEREQYEQKLNLKYQEDMPKIMAKAKEVDKELLNTEDLANKQMEARQTEMMNEIKVCERAKAVAACELEQKVVTKKYLRQEEKKKRKAEKEMVHEKKKGKGKGKKLLGWLAEKLVCGAGRSKDTDV